MCGYGSSPLLHQRGKTDTKGAKICSELGIKSYVPLVDIDPFVIFNVQISELPCMDMTEIFAKIKITLVE